MYIFIHDLAPGFSGLVKDILDERHKTGEKHLSFGFGAAYTRGRLVSTQWSLPLVTESLPH